MKRKENLILLLVFLALGSTSLYAHKLTPTSMGRYLAGVKSFGSIVSFTGSDSYDNDSQYGGYSPRWQWDFEYDGNVFSPRADVTTPTAVWKYSYPGTYTVALRYIDDDNQQGDIYTFQIVISSLRRFYYIKDHLGSIRQVIDESGKILSAQDYYSFGEVLREYNDASTTEKYKFTEKERDQETRLDYFGARYYDSEIGRWMSVDPLAEKYPGWSPYNYCLNNPLRVIDPDGLEVRAYSERLTTKTNLWAAIVMARHSYIYIRTPNKSLTLELGGQNEHTGSRGNPIMTNVGNNYNPFEGRINPYQITVTRPKGVGENDYSFENKIIEIFNIMKGRLPDYDILHANCNGFASFLIHAAGGDISYGLFNTAWGYDNEQEYWKVYYNYLREQQNKSSYQKESEKDEKKSRQYHGVPERQPEPILGDS